MSAHESTTLPITIRAVMRTSRISELHRDPGQAGYSRLCAAVAGCEQRARGRIGRSSGAIDVSGALNMEEDSAVDPVLDASPRGQRARCGVARVGKIEEEAPCPSQQIGANPSEQKAELRQTAKGGYLGGLPGRFPSRG